MTDALFVPGELGLPGHGGYFVAESGGGYRLLGSDYRLALGGREVLGKVFVDALGRHTQKARISFNLLEAHGRGRFGGCAFQPVVCPVPPVSTPSPTALLAHSLRAFAGLSAADLPLAEGHWTHRRIAKDGFFNFRNSACRHIGFIVSGLFRVYYIDLATAEEHDIFFLPEGLFLASLKSMVTQEVCPYYIAALEDAELLIISREQVQQLYAQSHG